MDQAGVWLRLAPPLHWLVCQISRIEQLWCRIRPTLTNATAAIEGSVAAVASGLQPWREAWRVAVSHLLRIQKGGAVEALPLLLAAEALQSRDDTEARRLNVQS